MNSSRVLAKITLYGDRQSCKLVSIHHFVNKLLISFENVVVRLWRAFIYTARRALSAHLFGTLVQYEYKWMHIYNINTRPDKAHTHSHTSRRDGQSSDNNCTVCRAKQTKTTKAKRIAKKWTANHIEKFNENKRTNSGSCRCQQPTTIQHESITERERESEGEKEKCFSQTERGRAHAREQPAFNSNSST